MFGDEQYILNQELCPTHEAWLAYAENRCDKQQEHAMEMHLQTCPMCSDAVELYMAGQGAEIKKIQKEVAQSINNQSSVKVIPIWKRILPLSIAASLLLGFFFWKNMENQEISEEITQQESKNTNVNNEETKPKEEPSIAILDDKAQPQTTDHEKPSKILEKPKPNTFKEANALAYNEKESPKTDTYTPAAATEVGTQSSSPAPTVLMSKASEKYMPNEDAITEQLRLAQDYFRNQNYSQAIEAYKTILRTEADNQEALFYLGKSEIARGMYQNALNPLEQINAPKFYDEAQWELAQSYLKINKLAKAKRMLKALSEKENAFQTKAKELLKSLGN